MTADDRPSPTGDERLSCCSPMIRSGRSIRGHGPAIIGLPRTVQFVLPGVARARRYPGQREREA